MEIVRIAALALVPLLAGCTLVDQRTFYPPTKPGPVSLEARPQVDRPALIIRVGPLEPDWHPAVAALVEQTLAKRPDARFEIVAAITPDGSAAEQTRVAREVAQAIGALGVPPSRLMLALRTATGQDISLFVR